MAPAGQQIEAGSRGRLILGFGQDAPADRDDGVGGENQRAGMPGGDGRAFGEGEAAGMVGGQFAGRAAAFVDFGCGMHPASARNAEPRKL